jgi:hypothetical protein
MTLSKHRVALFNVILSLAHRYMALTITFHSTELLVAISRVKLGETNIIPPHDNQEGHLTTSQTCGLTRNYAAPRGLKELRWNPEMAWEGRQLFPK